MKKKFKVLVSLILVAVMSLALLVPTFAASVQPVQPSEDSLVNWTLSADGKILTGDKDYYSIKLQQGYVVDILEVYHYHYTARMDGERLHFYTNYNDRNIVVAFSYAAEYYFVTESVKADLMEFFDVAKVKEKASGFIATQDGTYYYWFNDMIKILDAYSEANTINVSAVTLGQYDKTWIRAYDSTESIYTIVGCVYTDGGQTSYYVDYTKLPNNCFDADGNLSYRGGEVPVTPIAKGSEVDAALNNALSEQNGSEPIYATYYEKDQYVPPVNGGNSSGSGVTLDIEAVQIVGIIIFFIILVCIGLVLPVIPLVLGILLPRSKKLLKPRGWYTVAATSALWMLSAIVLIVLVTIILLINLI